MTTDGNMPEITGTVFDLDKEALAIAKGDLVLDQHQVVNLALKHLRETYDSPAASPEFKIVLQVISDRDVIENAKKHDSKGNLKEGEEIQDTVARIEEAVANSFASFDDVVATYAMGGQVAKARSKEIGAAASKRWDDRPQEQKDEIVAKQRATRDKNKAKASE